MIRGALTAGENSRKRVLVGETSRGIGGGSRLRFQVHLLDDYENLPFVRADNLYVQLFPAPRTQETNPELLGSDPLVAVYDLQGRYQYTSLEGGVDLPREVLRLPTQQSLWLTVGGQEGSYRVLFKRLEDRLLAVGFLVPTSLERIGAFVRTTLLGTAVAATLALLFRILAGAARGENRRQSPFFRRLVAMILAASLIPLLLLSFFLHRFLLREINEDIHTEGLASLGAARRIVKDYLTARPGSEEAGVDDDVAFWLSQVVRQDINFYSGDRLFATSAREIYASGLLSTRLDPEVYERLVLLQKATAFSEARLGALKYQTLSAPVAPGGGFPGILSLPLAEKRQEILRKRADVEEAILIVTVGMFLLLTVLAHFLARRVSEPVVALSDAARRIEAGDYDAEVRVPARDEPALLIESFNRMAASLRRQREDLRRRSDYIEKILLNATTGVISTDPSGRVVTINPAARVLLEFSGSGPEGMDLAALLNRDEKLAPLREALAGSDAAREKSWQISVSSGRGPMTLRIVSLPFRETPGSSAGRILLLEDLTEAVRSSRLEAWAEMARRIAHEIKNPLTPIQLSVDHLRRVRRSNDPRFDSILEDCLGAIQKQVQNLRHIAREFSDYARIPQLRPERIPVSELLQDVLGPLQSSPPEGIRIDSVIDAGTPDLLVDRELLRRALANLVQNALEAMPGGGILSLAVAKGDGPEPGGAPFVRIIVSDSGVGMDERTLSRLFEPYFSTKETGTGLGLSIVRKTVEEHGGRVGVHSAPGSGTRVTLDLPAAPEGARPAPPSSISRRGDEKPEGPAAL
jgi:signal transduction histidine kinase